MVQPHHPWTKQRGESHGILLSLEVNISIAVYLLVGNYYGLMIKCEPLKRNWRIKKGFKRNHANACCYAWNQVYMLKYFNTEEANKPNAETNRSTPLLQFLNYVLEEESQKFEPSAGWGNFLCCGRAMYLREVLVPEGSKRLEPRLLPSDLKQDSFHGVVTLPLSKTGQFGRVNLQHC